MKISKYQKEFLQLIESNPELIFESLSSIEIKKPLIWRDSIRNGGKLGTRGLAMKYGISRMTARTILKNIENNNKNG